MLELLILVFHRALEPIIAIQVHHDTALVEALMALSEISLYDKTEKPFFGLDLEYRSVVVAKMIICTLPKVCVRSCRDFERITVDSVSKRFPGPLERGKINMTAICQRGHNAIGENLVGRLFNLIAA